MSDWCCRCLQFISELGHVFKNIKLPVILRKNSPNFLENIFYLWMHTDIVWTTFCQLMWPKITLTMIPAEQYKTNGCKRLRIFLQRDRLCLEIHTNGSCLLPISLFRAVCNTILFFPPHDSRSATTLSHLKAGWPLRPIRSTQVATRNKWESERKKE